jgi:hypothetical protein
MTQTRLPVDTSSSRWIDGSATFSVVTSRRIRNCEQQQAASVQRWRAGVTRAV